MGILDPDGFLGGKVQLSVELAEKAVTSLDTTLSFGEVIASAWQVGLNNIAEGISDIAIRRGIDSRDFSLVAFGAGGPMLLPSLLDIVPMRRVIVPPSPGLFSALGLLSSDQVYSEQRSAYRLLGADQADDIDRIYAEMEDGLLRRIGAKRDEVELQRSFDGYLEGQGNDTPFIPVPLGPIGPAEVDQMVANFHQAYEQRFGTRFEYFPIQAITYRVELVVASDKVTYPELPERTAGTELTVKRQTLRHLYGGDAEVAVVERAELLRGDQLAGPAIVREETSTTFVPAGRNLTVGTYGELYVS